MKKKNIKRKEKLKTTDHENSQMKREKGEGIECEVWSLERENEPDEQRGSKNKEQMKILNLKDEENKTIKI